MARSVTTEVRSVNGGGYQRIYLSTRLTDDSVYPFAIGDPIRAQLVTTTGDKEVLVVLPETLEVDIDATELELRRSTQEVQVDLEGGRSP